MWARQGLWLKKIIAYRDKGATPFGQWAVRILLVASDRNPINWIISTPGTARFRGLNDIKTEIYMWDFQAQLFSKSSLLSGIYMSHVRSQHSQPSLAHLKVQWKGIFSFPLSSTKVLGLMSLNKNQDTCLFLNIKRWPKYCHFLVGLGLATWSFLEAGVVRRTKWIVGFIDNDHKPI